MRLELFNSIICNSIRAAFSNHAVISDDGHGWYTPGKISFTDPVFRENEFNSILEAKLMLFLYFCGIERYQLSPGWMDTELHRRDLTEHDLVKKIKAKDKKPIGVSMHCDAWEYPDNRGQQNDVSGFCVYYWGKGTKFSIEGRKMARCVSDAIIESDRINKHALAPRHDHGICPANFFYLRETDAPSILIENAFMTNDHDLALLQDDRFRNQRALAILQGLYDYVT